MVLKGKIQKLDSIRGFAAVYVVLHHLNQLYPFELTYLNLFFRFGQEAVILFFLMSGFVIYYSIFSKPNPDINFKDYFLKRFKRIYPLFILALALSYLTSCLYSGEFLPIEGKTLIGNLFSLQDFSSGKPGVWFSPYYGNLPLWSLSYEWWFYMIFWLLVKIPSKKQYPYVVAISVLGFLTYLLFPNSLSLIVLYLIIWWTGVEVAKLYLSNKNISFVDISYLIAGLFGVTLLLIIPILKYENITLLKVGLHPLLEVRHFIVASICLILCFLWRKIKFAGFEVLLGFFSKFAPISYAIYIFHYPIIKGIPYITFVSSLYLKVALALVFVLLFSYATEMKLQKEVNRLGKK